MEFLREPQERPYGTEAVFRDGSGNRYSPTERRAGGPAPNMEWSEVCD